MVVDILWERAFVLHSLVLMLFWALCPFVFSSPLVLARVICCFTMVVLLADCCSLCLSQGFFGVV